MFSRPQSRCQIKSSTNRRSTEKDNDVNALPCNLTPMSHLLFLFASMTEYTDPFRSGLLVPIFPMCVLRRGAFLSMKNKYPIKLCAVSDYACSFAILPHRAR